jgi:transcriptional regulator with XRE-family HTH domain
MKDPRMSSEQQKASIGAQVRRARKARGWTTLQLAHEAGVAQGTVLSVENGRNVRPGNLKAVMDALDVIATNDDTTPDESVKLALDLVKKWLLAMEPAERSHAVNDLVRFTMLGQHSRNS